MASDFADFNTETVSVETASAGAGMGPSFASAVPVAGVQVDEARRLVRDESGQQVVSEASIYDETLAHATLFTFGSRVTLPTGRVARVIAVKHHTALGLELPAHLEVILT